MSVAYCANRCLLEHAEGINMDVAVINIVAENIMEHWSVMLVSLLEKIQLNLEQHALPEGHT